MKKIFLTLACAAILGSAWAIGYEASQESSSEGAVAYGFLIADNDGRDVGLYSFPADDCSQPVLVAKSTDVSAGAMAGSTYYAMTYSGTPATAQTWNTVDLATGEFTKLADCGEQHNLYVDMTYDYSRGKLMGIYHYNGTSTIVADINLSDGTSTPYADLPGMWMLGLAASYDGEIYLIGRSNTLDYYLYSLDDARNLNQIGKVSSPADYMQSMEFDHKSGKLYWASCGSYSSYIYNVNTSTGQCTYLGSVGNNGELTGYYIPFKLSADGTPAAATGMEIANPAHDGNITVSFDVPEKTVDGKPLSSVTGWKVMCDDNVIDVPFTSAVPGAKASFEVTVPQGLHVIKVALINETGVGAIANRRMFIGTDIPAAPKNITVKADGNKAVVTWEAVTSGAQGGWINADAVTYNVLRKPDDKTIATGLTATTVNDEVTETNGYQYLVYAMCEGKEGAVGASEIVAVGDGLELPYECSFSEQVDFALWSIIDVNNDGNTWKYTSNFGNPAMMVRSTMAYECDEWLITPGLKLETGKEYKISFDAGAMNPSYPPEFSICMGTSSDPETLTRQVYSGSVDELFPDRNIIYLPEITAAGTYYLGIHAKWDKGYPALYFNNVKIEENHAARLDLNVTDTNNSAIEGATVTFGKDKYLSDAQGNVKIIEIEPGEYTIGVEKFGYEPVSQSITFKANENKTHSIALTNIPQTSVKGVVKDADGKPLAEASVYVHGYDNYKAVTAADGSFDIANVYAKGKYSIEVHAINYLPAAMTVDNIGTETVETGDIVLQEKLTSPDGVTYTADRNKVELGWEAPVDREETFRYDDGNVGMINSYDMSPGINYNTVTGTVFDTPAVFTGMSFRADNRNDIGIILFDLDENGEPTGDILYEQTVKGDDWYWVDVTFTHPVIAPRGAMLALRGNSRLYFDGNTDGTRNDGFPVRSNKMWLSYDYTSPDTPFHWIMSGTDDEPLFNYNFCLRAYGRTLGAPRSKSASAQGHATGYHVWRLPAGSESKQADWVKLTDTPTAEAAYVDNTWNTAEKGLYRYAVKAVYKGDEVSYAAFSDIVPRQLTSAVTITLLTNAPGESAAGAAAVLVEKDGEHNYQATADADGVLSFSNVWEGEYTLTATCDGFAPLSGDISVSGDKDLEQTFTLKELTAMPSNLVAEETDAPDSRLLRWNFSEFIFDDFESYDDFTVDPAGEIEWSYIDADGIDDIGLQNDRYPGITSAAFVVLNAATSNNPRYTPAHSGERAIFSLRDYNLDQTTDDYIVSPELSFKADFVVNFWVYSYWKRDDYIRVGYSTTGKDLEDFTWIGDKKELAKEEEWINETFTVPAAAKYVAINYGETYRGGGIDDIYIGPADKIPGVTASNAPARVAGKAQRYEVYLDNERLGETQNNEWLLENLTTGNHQAGVKSIYASGASEMAVVNFSIATSGIIGNISESFRITSTPATITITGIGESDTVAVYDVAGRQAAVSRTGNTAVAGGLANGVYIVKVNDRAFTMIVK